MPSWLSGITTAIQRIGISAGGANTPAVSYRRSSMHPQLAAPAGVRQGFEGRGDHYAMLWAWYLNTAFDNKVLWRSYLQEYGLYRGTRSIYNPVRRLVDFYAASVYPGVLAIDGNKLPDGVSLAIPLTDDTAEALKLAIAQWWQWSNWQAGKAVMVRYGACTGDVLVELDDDLERKKVTSNIVWPGYVSDLRLDATGNVKFYALEYRSVDERGQPFIYRKEMDTESFRTYKDDQAFGFNDQAPEIENPYGFVPAVWVKHVDLGGDHGAGAVRGLSKFDELNSLASHAHDHIHKAIGSPRIFWADGPINNLAKAVHSAVRNRARGTVEDDGTPANQLPLDIPDTDREQVLLMKGPANGKTEPLIGELSLEGCLNMMKQLILEINHDHPELSMYSSLRDMSQVTGPAASRMMGDVAGLVVEAQANYDQRQRQLHEMAVAIGGFRANKGDWGPKGQLTRQQRKFLPFDLTSYQKGELDHDIAPRPLVPPTALERLELERATMQLQVDRKGLMIALGGGMEAPPETIGGGKPPSTDAPAPALQVIARQNGAAGGQNASPDRKPTAGVVAGGNRRPGPDAEDR